MSVVIYFVCPSVRLQICQCIEHIESEIEVERSGELVMVGEDILYVIPFMSNLNPKPAVWLELKVAQGEAGKGSEFSLLRGSDGGHLLMKVQTICSCFFFPEYVLTSNFKCNRCYAIRRKVLEQCIAN